MSDSPEFVPGRELPAEVAGAAMLPVCLEVYHGAIDDRQPSPDRSLWVLVSRVPEKGDEMNIGSPFIVTAARQEFFGADGTPRLVPVLSLHAKGKHTPRARFSKGRTPPR